MNDNNKRCYVCDYSPINGEVKPKVVFIYDRLYDGHICSDCAGAIREALQGFGVEDVEIEEVEIVTSIFDEEAQ